MATHNGNSPGPRLYGRAWAKARAEHLRSSPLCVMHQRRKLLVPATVVDHLKPHRGDLTLFWDRNNWQSLCKHCHDSHKQRQEKSGRASAACDTTGMPTDPSHPWFGA